MGEKTRETGLRRPIRIVTERIGDLLGYRPNGGQWDLGREAVAKGEGQRDASVTTKCGTKNHQIADLEVVA